MLDNISRSINIIDLIDGKTDIIMIHNDIDDEDNIQSHIEETYSRPVNVISVKNLTTTEILKRVTYNLLKRNTFSPQDHHAELFTTISELTMGTATITNIVTALFKKYGIDVLSEKINHCIKSCTIEKQLLKNSANIALTCNALIKSFVSPEAQMLLNAFSIICTHGIPIPFFIIEEVENLICDSPISDSCCFKELINFSIVRKYPYPCVYKNTERTTNLSDQYIEFYYIPKLICNAVLEQSEGAEHLLNILLLLKAIELNISEDTNDKIKLELIFEILTVLYNHSDNNWLLSRCMHLKIKIAYILHYSDIVP